MQRATHWLADVLFFAVAAATGNCAWASHTFCVTSSAGVGNVTQLTTALNYSVTAVDETVYIHLEKGTYTLPGDQQYNQDGNGGNASLHIVGSFVPGTSCKQRVLDPASTIVLGANVPSAAPVSFLRIGQEEGELLIDGIEFASFADGMDVRTASDSTVTIRNVIITDMHNVDGFSAGALTVGTYNVSGSSSIRVENSLIYGNHSVTGLIIASQHSGDSAQVLNNTIVGNDVYGLYLGYPSGTPLAGKLVAYNNIIRDNAAADIYALNVEPDSQYAISYSDFNSISGPSGGVHNINKVPQFAGSGVAPYDLLSTSPVINQGAAAALVAGGYANTDIRGRTRVIGSHVDMGAYESPVDDNIPQTVTLIDDTTGAGTLRAALAVANSNPNPTTIDFNITNDGACPHIIDLGSMLPNISTDITIDGYTQPGAAENSIVPGYNGNICIVLRGGGVDHALQTSGGGRLTVRGIEFENFSTAAIRLASGNGHVVTGNGFAAFTDGLFANKDGVLIEGTATGSQIGSYAFGDRNVFAQSSDAAIKLASNGVGNHVIQGNYIGFNFDGTQWSGAPNKYGIYALDSGTNTISYNFIGRSQLNAIHLTGTNASANRIIENSIGIAPADDSAAGNGLGTCSPICFGGQAIIDVAAGAHGNFIGALGGSGGNNVIVNNYGPGVEVESNAGTGNRVYGNNLIHDNGGYLAIDLGTPGPTLNDVGDGDSGGNNLQNYPTLSQAVRIEAGVVRLSGSLVAPTGVAAQVYRLDFYWTDSCLFSGSGSDTPRGELKRYVGFMNLYSDGTAFNVPFSNIDIVAAIGIPKNGYLSAIATDAAGNTSEPGPCHVFVDDYIFADGFGH